MSLTLVIEPHPLLDAGAFVTRTAHPLAELVTPVYRDLVREIVGATIENVALA